MTTLRAESRQFSATAPAFNLPHLHLALLLWVTVFEFCRDLRHRNTRFPELSCGVVCVIQRLAVPIEQRLATDRQTGQTQHDDMYRASMASRGKKEQLYTDYTVDATHSDLQVAIYILIEWAKHGNCRYQLLSAQHFVLIIHSGT